MADSEAPAPGGAATAEMPKPDGRIIINTHYIKDLSFENPNAPAIFAQREGHNIRVGIEVHARNLQDRLYEVTLAIKCSATMQNATAFILELEFAGLVTVGELVPETELEELLQIEVPRYLFPFARNVIADVTRDGGYPPLLINPVDFAALRAQQAKQGAA